MCKVKKGTHNGGSLSGRKSGVNSLNLNLDPNMQHLTIDVTCSYLEIYNEVIIDLLDPASNQKIQIRESAERGVYPEPCTEEHVESIEDVLDLI